MFSPINTIEIFAIAYQLIWYLVVNFLFYSYHSYVSKQGQPIQKCADTKMLICLHVEWREIKTDATHIYRHYFWQIYIFTHFFLFNGQSTKSNVIRMQSMQFTFHVFFIIKMHVCYVGMIDTQTRRRRQKRQFVQFCCYKKSKRLNILNESTIQ